MLRLTYTERHFSEHFYTSDDFPYTLDVYLKSSKVGCIFAYLSPNYPKKHPALDEKRPDRDNPYPAK